MAYPFTNLFTVPFPLEYMHASPDIWSAHLLDSRNIKFPYVIIYIQYIYAYSEVEINFYSENLTVRKTSLKLAFATLQDNLNFRTVSSVEY